MCVVVTYSGYRTGRLERERSVVCLNVVCVCFQVSEGFLFFQKKGVIQVRERLRDQVVALHVHGAQRKQARKASKRKKLHWLAAMANAGKFLFFFFFLSKCALNLRGEFNKGTLKVKAKKKAKKNKTKKGEEAP